MLQKPSHGWLKCNYDAAFNPHTKQVTSGWIVRDYQGVAKYWGSAQLGHAVSALEAEILSTIQNVWAMGYTKVCFEGDCQVLVNMIQGVSNDISITNLCKYISFWARRIQEIHFTHVMRKCNTVAHILAERRPCKSLYFSNCVYPPSWLTSSLYREFVLSR